MFGSRATLVTFAITMVLLFGGPDDGQAALAPQYERWRQLGVVTSDESVVEKLYPHGSVTRIDAMKDGSYRVWAGTCFVMVTINFNRSYPAIAGTPQVSSVTVGDVVCRKQIREPAG